MKVFVSTLFALFFICSCNESNCVKNHFFDLKFRYSLDVIDVSENGQDVFIDDKLNAMYFLKVVTGHESQIEDIEYPLYKNQSLYLQDKKKWEEWYTNHRCSLSDHEIDSLLLAYKSLFD
mgnify:CR=1 FL=1|jgi:hypothetical protein